MVRDIIGLTPEGATRSRLVNVPTQSGTDADRVAKGYGERLLGWTDVRVEKPRAGVQSADIVYLDTAANLRAMLAVWESRPE